MLLVILLEFLSIFLDYFEIKLFQIWDQFQKHE